MRGPEGAVDGADVILVAPDSGGRADAPPRIEQTRTSGGGHFHFGPLAAGTYALNAVAPALTPVFGTHVTVAAGEARRGVELRLGDGGFSVHVNVTDLQGKPVPGARLFLGPDDGDAGSLIPVPLDEAGAAALSLPRGDYALAAFAPGLPPQRSSAGIREPRTLAVAFEEPPATSAPSPEVLAWVKQAALPLSTVEPGSGFDDLRALKPALEGVRVVGLGEATHGTHEFFRLKHRLLEYLATELGFTLFAIEANFSEAQAVNEYVLTGKGDPAQALAGLYFWVTDTEEVLDLIKWMRAYNADRRHPRKLQFQGIDMQFTPAATRAVLEYLGKVDPAYRDRVEGPLSPLLERDALGTSPGPEREKKLAPFVPLIREIATRLATRREAYSRRSSPREWALASRHARVLGQFVELNQVGYAEGFALRDRAMAENAQWILEQAGPEAKMVLWAHNGHVGAWRDRLTVPTLGKHLREAFGRAYYAFGFAFDEGSFQAIYIPEGPKDAPRGLIPHTVPPDPPGTLGDTLNQVGLPLLALDLRSLPPEGPVNAFWHERRGIREVGAGYGSTEQSLSYIHTADEFDGLLFVQRTTAAHPTPTGMRPPKPIPGLTAPPSADPAPANAQPATP